MSAGIILGTLEKGRQSNLLYIRINPSTVLVLNPETNEVRLRPYRGGAFFHAENVEALINIIGYEHGELWIAQQVDRCLKAGRELTTFVFDAKRLNEDREAYQAQLGERLESQGRARRNTEAA